jgi:hypothetical protein
MLNPLIGNVLVAEEFGKQSGGVQMSTWTGLQGSTPKFGATGPSCGRLQPTRPIARTSARDIAIDMPL